ncbi:hypothetical protein, partial [Prevotella sp.]
ILFHSYTLFYSLQRGQGIFIAINYTHVFSGDPKFLYVLHTMERWQKPQLSVQYRMSLKAKAMICRKNLISS